MYPSGKWNDIPMSSIKPAVYKRGGARHVKNHAAFEIKKRIDACLKSLKSASGESAASSGAYIKNISIADEDVRKHWSKHHEPLAEYKKAFDMICLEREWMTNTMLLRQIRVVGDLFKEDLNKIRKGGEKAFDRALESAIRKAYGKGRDAKDLLSGTNVFQQVKKVYNALESWKRPFMVHAFLLLSQFEDDKSAIVTKLSEIVDRSLHCRQVQVKSFNLVISHCFRLLTNLHDASTGNVSYGPFERALLRFYEVFEDFVDDHKEHAFISSFQEPARFYFTIAHGRDWRVDNVDTHGNNWYLALLNATLSIHLPLLPAYWDNWPNSVVDFWKGLKDEAWRDGFSKKCGVGVGGIAALKGGKSKFYRENCPHAQFPRGYTDMNPAKKWANEAVNPSSKRAAHRRKLALYVERFCTFFKREFFIQKAFNKLNSEEKPEHAGFRNASEVLFQTFRREQKDVVGDSFIEYAFQDELYTKLAVKRIDRFFVWLGVLKPGPDSDIGPAGAYVASSGTASMVHIEENPSEIDLELQKVTTDLNSAMRNRQSSRIKKLMKLRTELQKKKLAEKKKRDDCDELREANAMGPSSLEQINKDLQVAMQQRDTKKIRLLMRKRDEMKKSPSRLNVRGVVEIQSVARSAKAGVGKSSSAPTHSNDALPKSALSAASVPPPVAQVVVDAIPIIDIFERSRSLDDEEDFQTPAEVLSFIDEFLSVFAQSMKSDTQFRAAVFERWQFFELTYDDNPAAIKRAARLMAEDRRFATTITDCIRGNKLVELRDTAGILFRLFGMVMDNEIAIGEEHRQRLEDAINSILQPLERKNPEKLDGHFVGALYMQAVCPFLCCARNETSNFGVAELVRRVGRACVNWYASHPQKQQFLNTTHMQYMQLSHNPVWGSQQDDLVWKHIINS